MRRSFDELKARHAKKPHAESAEFAEPSLVGHPPAP